MEINTSVPNGVGGNAAVVASLKALKAARDAPMQAALEVIQGVAEPQTFNAQGQSSPKAAAGEHLDAKA